MFIEINSIQFNRNKSCASNSFAISDDKKNRPINVAKKNNNNKTIIGQVFCCICADFDNSVECVSIKQLNKYNGRVHFKLIGQSTVWQTTEAASLIFIQNFFILPCQCFRCLVKWTIQITATSKCVIVGNWPFHSVEWF